MTAVCHQQLDVGFRHDAATPVSEDYATQENRFTGVVRWVQLDAGLDSHDHLISAEDHLWVAMATQSDAPRLSQRPRAEAVGQSLRPSAAAPDKEKT